MKTKLLDPFTRSRKKNTAIFIAVFLLLATACSSSDIKVADEGDIPTSEEETGDEEADSSESEETATDTSTEETEETDEGEIEEEAGEEEEPVECPWDVGMKTGDTSYGPGSSFLVDARVGAHTEYDRFVLEFESGDATPDSYVINWTTLRPERDGSGLPVEVDGDVFLSFSIGASVINWDGAEEIYDGPTSLSSPLFGNLVEVESGGYFEGRMLWAIGANEANGFQVLELEDPPRLVVDVCVADASSTKGEDCIDSGMHPSLCGALFDYDGGYTGPHAEHAEMFGTGECPSAPELTATASTTTSYFADLDGDGDDEEAFTYYETFDEGMYLRVINGPDKIDYLLASGGTAFVPSGNAVVGAIDLQTDDKPELFVTTQGGSPGSPRGVLLFQIEDCELVTIKNHGTDFDFSLPVGSWSAGGHSYGIDCVGGAPVLRELHSYPGSSTPPVTTWLWTRTTHELLADNTMIEVSVSDEFSGSEIPWDIGFNSCTFE